MTRNHAEELPLSSLQQLEHYYNQAGIVARIIAPEEQTPYYSLVIRFEELGDRGTTIDLELCYVPGLEPLEQEGVYILQSFAALGGPIQSSAAPLLELIAYINLRLPLGAFGVNADERTLYFKHNMMLHRLWLEDASFISRIDMQNGMLLSQFVQFAEWLIDVASGRQRADHVLSELRSRMGEE
ncbi:MAG: hypothetical protein K0Q59_5192 [Paenibacillus sp.]|jgi:hypothetical protein|nr:hypothetical protein [Paenibacillus sp.]